MFNCNESVLVDSVHNDVLYRIIKHYNHVRIPGDNPIDIKGYVKDEPDNEWEILDRDGVNVYSNQTYVEEAREMPEVRADHPNDVFLFDSSKYDNPATNPYGVLAMSGNSINKRYLTRNWEYRISIEKDNNGKARQYSWKEILGPFHKGKTPPSNALVFVDRYLFSYSNRGKVDYKNGIRNVLAILNELLPDSFSGEYQILLVFDPKQISDGATVDDVTKGLQSIKKMIRPGKYLPTIELLPIRFDYDKEIYSETHDRRIISNYFSIDASHGFSAILPSASRRDDITYTGFGEGTYGQKIVFNSHYHGIDKDEEDLNLDALPVTFCDETLRYLNRYYKRKIGSSGAVEYICNGNRHCDISQLRNRLITSI